MVDLAYLIDNNEVDLFIQKRFIEVSGFAKEIKTYKSAIQALSDLQQNSQIPGVIFLDLNMPDMNGFSFLDQFEEISKNFGEAVPMIIILTSSNSKIDMERVKKYPIVKDFLTKPLKADMLKNLH